jgi:hypothetical protein
MKSPAAPATTLLLLIQFALKSLEHVERIAESGFRKCLGRSRRPAAATAEKEYYIIAAYLRFHLAHEPRIALQSRACHPRHMDAVLYPSDELTLLSGAHVKQDSGVISYEIPGLLRSDAAGVARL